MDEASRILQLPPCIVIATLARQAAIKAVKQQLQAQGIKLYHFAQRDIAAMANEYAAANRARLLAETVERVQRSPELRELYDREKRRRQALIRRRFCCANLMNEMESRHDRRLRAGIDGWTDARRTAGSASSCRAQSEYSRKRSAARSRIGRRWPGRSQRWTLATCSWLLGSIG